MGALTDAIYERGIQDQKNFEKKVKFRKFMDIALPTGVVLGASIVVGSMFFGSIKLGDLVGTSIQNNQDHLKSIENKPLVFEEKQVGDCKVNYIETSHQNSVGTYQQDLYLKSTCGDQVVSHKSKRKNKYFQNEVSTKSNNRCEKK